MYHTMFKSPLRPWFVSIVALALSLPVGGVAVWSAESESNSATAQAKSTTSTATASDSEGSATVLEVAEAEPKSEAVESVQEDVDKDAEEKTDAKRQKLVKEAVSAVAMTREALASLGEGKVEEALDALAEVTGKLELVIARSPELSSVPVGVTTRIYDVLAEKESVERLVDEAEEAMDDGRVQDARRLLRGLASEIVISTSHMPMATYPNAIKAVAPLIDEGKIDEAKQQLQLALNLLVVTDTVYPLPTMRANALLDEAEQLAEKSDRSSEENDRLENLLNEARSQVELGRELGYFVNENADSIYDELEAIEKKTGKGKSGKGFFERIRGLFGSLSW